MFMNPRAFLHFKDNSDISRTLVRNHFKPKMRNGIEKRCEDVIKVYDLNVENWSTIKRLEGELEVLKNVNKALYMVGKKDLNRIKESEKDGLAPGKIKELIAELMPESFMPDENDLVLQALEKASKVVTEKLNHSVNFDVTS